MNAVLPSASSPMEAEVSRALPLTQKQVTAICKGAQKAGYAAIVEVGNVRLRLIPEEHVIPAQPERPIDKDEDIVL